MSYMQNKLKMAIFHKSKGNNYEFTKTKGEQKPRCTTIHAYNYFCEDFMVLGEVHFELHVTQAKNGHFSNIQGP